MTDTPPPINIDRSPWPRLTWQTMRVFITAAGSAAAGILISNGYVAGAVISVIPPLISYAYGVFMYLRDHSKLRALEPYAPDDVAKLK